MPAGQPPRRVELARITYAVEYRGRRPRRVDVLALELERLAYEVARASRRSAPSEEAHRSIASAADALERLRPRCRAR